MARKPYPGIDGMRNVQRLLKPQNPRIGDINVEDLIDNRYIRKLDDSGFFDRVYGRVTLIALFREMGDRPCRSGQFENVHACIGAVDDINVAAIVDFWVVRLNRNLAALAAARLRYTAFVGLLRDGGNVIAYLFGTIRIANIDRTHAGIEVGD